MGARLVVQSGVSAGSVHWIERNVVRVGSSAKSDMCIPSTEVDEHALTVEFRQGGYFVYSRSREPCYLSGQVLQRNQPHQWHDTDLVELPGGVQLSLDCDQDPTPGPPPASQPSWMAEETVEEEVGHSSSVSDSSTSAHLLDETNASKPQSNGKALQWLVILFCVVGSIGLLALDQLDFDAEQVEQLSFDSVVREALLDGAEVDGGLIASLQKAEVSMLRGNIEKARAQYARLHRLLEDSSESQQLQQVAQLVEQRLVQLGQL